MAQDLIPEDVMLRNLILQQCDLQIENVRFTRLVRGQRPFHAVTFIIFEGFIELPSIYRSDYMRYDMVDHKTLCANSQILKKIPEEKVRSIFSDVRNKKQVVWDLFDDEEEYIDSVISDSGDEAMSLMYNTTKTVAFARPSVTQQTSM